MEKAQHSFAAATLLLAGAALAQPSQPDLYEGAPWFDSSPLTTQNWFPAIDAPFQEHTIHTPEDEDWFLAYEGDEGTDSVRIAIENAVLPAGAFLLVAVYSEANTDLENLVTFKESDDTLFDVPWDREGRVVYAQITLVDENFEPLEELDEQVSYSVQFSQTSAPNSGVIIQGFNGGVEIQWNTQGLKNRGDGKQLPAGFNVYRRNLAPVTGFVRLNSAIIPIPEQPGPCQTLDSPGCASYTDRTAEPGQFYEFAVELEYSDGSTEDWQLPIQFRQPSQLTEIPEQELWLIQ